MRVEKTGDLWMHALYDILAHSEPGDESLLNAMQVLMVREGRRC